MQGSFSPAFPTNILQIYMCQKPKMSYNAALYTYGRWHRRVMFKTRKKLNPARRWEKACPLNVLAVNTKLPNSIYNILLAKLSVHSLRSRDRNPAVPRTNHYCRKKKLFMSVIVWSEMMYQTLLKPLKTLDNV